MRVRVCVDECECVRVRGWGIGLSLIPDTGKPMLMSGLLASLLCSLPKKLVLRTSSCLPLRPGSKAQGPWFVSTTLVAWNEIIDA